MDAAGWDDRYREKPLLWSHGPNRFVAEELAGINPGAALDVACGEGRNAVWLAEQGWTVTGVDFSAVALERAQKMASERGVDVTWVNADITAWYVGDVFDLVLVAYVHLFPPEFEELMRRATSWVAPGGRLFMVGHDRSTLGVSGPSDPDLAWDVDMIADLMGSLSVERARVGYRVTDTGQEAADTVVMARQAG
ncbi:MAG: class I SAM-dependent methyltransferase [Acidimicrobiia bacterium]